MDQVKLEQIRILFRLSPSTYFLSTVVALIDVCVFGALIDRVLLVSWFVLFVVVTTVRYGVVRVFLKQYNQEGQADWWARIYCIGAIVSGCLWAVLALQFDATWPAVHQVVMICSMAGIVAGAVGTHSCYFPALACFYSPIMLSVVWVAASQNDPEYYWLAPLVLIFWAIIHISGKRFSGMLTTNIRMQQSLSIANEQLELLSRLDSLTQLQNRGALETYLSETWETYQQSQRPVSIAMIDVDQFKAYNDQYGHVQGDQCLTHVANVLRLVIPDELGFVGRYGGEEFIVVLPGVSRDEAHKILRKAQKALKNEEIAHAGSTVAEHLTVSMGIESAVPLIDDDWVELIDRADAKLYIAKQRGRNQIV